MLDDQVNIVPKEFAFLKSQFGFQVVSSWELPSVRSAMAPRIAGALPRTFGDAENVLASNDFRVRFIRDRGDLYVDICPAREAGDEWHTVQLVRALILQSDPAEDPTLAELAGFLKEHFALIKELFILPNIETTNAKLEYLRRDRIKKMFPGGVIEEE